MMDATLLINGLIQVADDQRWSLGDSRMARCAEREDPRGLAPGAQPNLDPTRRPEREAR